MAVAATDRFHHRLAGARGQQVSDSTGIDDSIAAAQLWQAVLAELRGQLNRTAWDNYFAQTTLQAVDEEQATVSAPNAFTATTLQSRYASPVERAIQSITGQRLRVEFVVRPGGSADRLPRPPRPARRRPQRDDVSSQADQPALGNRQLELDRSGAPGLNPRLTYDTYVVGSSNRFAHAASLAVADQPGGKFNPFFVYGGVGLGKTHLLHAIGHRAIELNPELTVVYVSSETLTNDLINAIRAQ
jgi:chromosomal replication initiator protein